MIKGLTFVSRVVRDLDTSLAFYHDMLGLEVVMAPTEASGPEMDAMTGIEGVKLRIVMLKGLQGATLELMQFLSPPGKESTGVDASEIGHTFIAMEVNDIEQVVAELQRRGANFQMPVQEYQNGKFAYLWGPDMELVELMEYAWPPSAF